jgi:hypothetical protein
LGIVVGVTALFLITAWDRLLVWGRQEAAFVRMQKENSLDQPSKTLDPTGPAGQSFCHGRKWWNGWRKDKLGMLDKILSHEVSTWKRRGVDRRRICSNVQRLKRVVFKTNISDKPEHEV